MEVAKNAPGTEGRAKKRTGTSKYDFFKVKVWLGENMDHYYVLSRFLICRMLTVTKIPYIKAVKIALETKKYLVDNNLQDVTQAELENVLFSIIRSKGFDEQYIDCYRMVTQFYQQRQPLCIIVCGTAWTGKSTIAQQLASRINIPNVMQTDVIYELLRAGGDSSLNPSPLWCRRGLSDSALVAEFRREACVVRKGMDGDLIKTLSDGKPIIIEGMHLDPGLYIQDFGRRGIIMLPAKPAAGLSPARGPANSPARAAAAAAAQSPLGSTAKAVYGRSLTMPSRREALSTVEASFTAAAAKGAGSSSGSSQQQGVSCSRSMSVGVEFGGAGPVAAAIVQRLAPTPELPVLEDGTGAAGAQQWQMDQSLQQLGDRQQQQPQQACLRQHGQCQESVEEGSTDMESSIKRHTSTNWHFPRVLATASRGHDSNSSSTQCPSTPAIKIQANTSPNSSSSTAYVQHSAVLHSTSSTQEAQDTALAAVSLAGVKCHRTQAISAQLTTAAAADYDNDMTRDAAFGRTANSVADQQTGQTPSTTWPQKPEATAAAAAAVTMSPAACGPISPAVSPAVVMLGELQVCAATAEAAALQQHWQQYQQRDCTQQQQQQQRLGLAPPASPFSSAESEGGRGLSPSLSQEHSTTEVVSRQQSCCSPLLLSQEPSAAEVGTMEGSAGTWCTFHKGGSDVNILEDTQHELHQQAQNGIAVSAEHQPAQLQHVGNGQHQQQLQQPELVVQGNLQYEFRTKVLQSSRRYHHLIPAGNCTAGNGVVDVAAVGVAVSSSLHNSCTAELAVVASEVQQQVLQHCPPGAEPAVDRPTATTATKQVAASADPNEEPGQQHCQQQGIQQWQPLQQECMSWLPLQQPADGCVKPGMPPATCAAEDHRCTRGEACRAAGAAAAGSVMDLSRPGPSAGAAAPPRASTQAPEAQTSTSSASGSEASQQQQQQQQQDSNAGAKLVQKEPVQRPLFVPILVYMDEADHVLMQEEALAHCGLSDSHISIEATAAAEGGNTCSSASVATGSSELSGDTAVVQATAPEALRRMRLLQEYLCAYEAQGLPVVKVSYGNFGEALDKLHEYILQCIKCAQSTSL